MRNPGGHTLELRMAFSDGDAGIESALYFVRGHMHYLEHPPDEQQLITPDALLYLMGVAPDHRAVGDCVSYTVLLGSLLLPRRLRLVVRSKREDLIYDHVYLRVFMHRGWVPIDPSGEAAIGWEETDGITARLDLLV
jgi:hypothetical protein